MSDATTRSEPPRFDDRIDTQPQITTREVFLILKRALTYVWPARGLFLLKFFLMVGSVVPALVATWPLKILIDHVIQANPYDASAVRFPPYIQPFIDATAGLDPTGLLLATLAFLLILAIVFGVGAGGGYQLAFMAQGEDTASQAEKHDQCRLVNDGWYLGIGRPPLQHPAGPESHELLSYGPLCAPD